MSELREESIKSINNIIKNKQKSKIIEESINNYAKEYCNSELSELFNEYFILIYKSKLNSILKNIDTKSHIENNYLFDAIKSNTIDLINIAFLNNNELYPKNWENLIKIIENRNELNKDKVSYTNEFECFKCGKNETFIFQLQTRSGDEAMTTFITCKHCKNSWKDS